MGSLVAAYVLGWIAVSLYATWLGVQNWRLSRRLEQLEALSRQGTASSRRKAA